MKPAKLLDFVITATLTFGLFGCTQDARIESLSEPPESAATAVAMSSTASVTANFDEEEQQWIECTIPLPEEDGTLSFLRRHIHPFMAEYSRKVRIGIPDDKPVCCPLPINVGGRTLINVYWIDEKDSFGPLVLLRDHWGESLVDLATRETLRLVRVGADRVFAGHIDNERAGVGWTGTSDDAVDDLRVHVGQNIATDITRFSIYDRLQYLGRLDGRFGPLRFISASEASEERIKMIRI